MTISRTARTLGLGSAAALLALTAACGGTSSAGSSSTGSSRASSSSSTSSSPSASDSASTSDAALTTSDIGQKLVAAQQRAGSYTYRLTTTSKDVTTKGSGEVSTAGGRTAVHSTLGVEGQTVEVILSDGLYYLKAPFLKSDKPWLRIDPKEKTGLGAVLGQVSGSSDPGRSLAAMVDASRVTKVGAEKFGSVDTTHYRVVLPREALVKSLGMSAQLAALLPAELTYDLYVDADDLVRRYSSTTTVQNITSDTTVTFDDYGKPVSISAPPAAQTTTKSTLGG
jgi:hypothetical protein